MIDFIFLFITLTFIQNLSLNFINLYSHKILGKYIKQTKYMQTCQIHFIDCMGYWDLLSEFLSLSILIFILTSTIKNIKKINTEFRSFKDSESRKCCIRKFIVNGVSFVYQAFLLISIIFSVLIFLIYKDSMQEALQNKVNLWYKWSQIIFINLLNCLNLTVGFLYWKAVRAYFKICEKQLPIIYFSHFKGVFILFYGINFSIIILSLFMLLMTDQTHFQKTQIKIVNAMNAVGVSCSTIICLVSRLLYQKHILKTLSMSPRAIRNQSIYSFFIGFSSAWRFACVSINIAGIDYSLSVRNFDENCRDETPYHGILMFAITILINILPSFIFNFVFAGNKKKKKSQAEQFLSKNSASDETIHHL